MCSVCSGVLLVANEVGPEAEQVFKGYSVYSVCSVCSGVLLVTNAVGPGAEQDLKRLFFAF